MVTPSPSASASAAVHVVPSASSLLPWAQHHLGLVVVAGLVVVVLLLVVGPKFTAEPEGRLDRFQRDKLTLEKRQFYAANPKMAPRGPLLLRFLRWFFRGLGEAVDDHVIEPRRQAKRSAYEAQREHEREERERAEADKSARLAEISRIAAEERARAQARQLAAEGKTPHKARLPKPKVDLWDR